MEKENTAQALLRLCLLTVQVDSIRLELPQSALPASKDISAQLKTVVPIPNAFMYVTLTFAFLVFLQLNTATLLSVVECW